MDRRRTRNIKLSILMEKPGKTHQREKKRGKPSEIRNSRILYFERNRRGLKKTRQLNKIKGRGPENWPRGRNPAQYGRGSKTPSPRKARPQKKGKTEGRKEGGNDPFRRKDNPII